MIYTLCEEIVCFPVSMKIRIFPSLFYNGFVTFAKHSVLSHVYSGLNQIAFKVPHSPDSISRMHFVFYLRRLVERHRAAMGCARSARSGALSFGRHVQNYK